MKEIKTLNEYDVVYKLIGKINPVGDSHRDSERFENLKLMCSLVEKLIVDIDSVAMEKDSHMGSVSYAGEYAYNFISNSLNIHE